MSETPLRQLFAQFVFSVDPSGIRKANAAVDSVKSKTQTAITTLDKSAPSAFGKFANASTTATRRALSNMSGLFSKLSAIGASTAQTTAAQASSAISGGVAPAGKAIDGLKSQIMSIAPMMAGVFAVTRLVTFTRSMISTADATGKMATALGLASDQIQEITEFSGLGGVDEKVTLKALRTMSRVSGMFKATGKGGEVFKQLGVEEQIKNTTKLSDQFFIAGAALNDIEDDTQKAAIAQKLWGGTGISLVTAFAGGLEQTLRYRKRIAEIGPIFDDKFTKDAADFNDELQFTGTSIKAIGAGIIAALMPTLVLLLKTTAKVSLEIKKFTQNSALLATTLSLILVKQLRGYVIPYLSRLFAVMRAGTLDLGAFFKRAAAGAFSFFWLTLLVGSIEDLFVFIRGGDSIISRLIDRIYGVGASTKALAALKQWWADFGPSVLSSAKSVIRFGASFAKIFISILGYLTSTGAAKDRWRAALIKAADDIVAKFDWMIKPLGEFFFWLSDTWDNMVAKLSKFNPGNWFGGGNPTSNPVLSAPMSRPTLPASGSKSVAIRDERKLTLNFHGAVSPTETKAAVGFALDSDRSKTAKAAGL